VLHGIVITIAQMTGRKKGQFVKCNTDVIYAQQSGKLDVRKIGFIERHNNAKISLIRHLRGNLREDVCREVARLRAQQPEGFTVSGQSSMVIDPKIATAYIKGELHKHKTTIVRPDGELFNPPDDEEDDDE